jgi:5'(3')-deoxyribonucleotidase
VTRRVLIDVDGVIGDLVGALCHELRLYGYRRTPEDIRTYDFAGSLTEQETNMVHGIMGRPGFCGEISWYPGAKEFVEELSSTLEVVAVTRPFESGPTWAHEREHWLKPHIRKVVSTAHKEVCVGDLLIEDSTENALRWLAYHPGKRCILIDRPWNRSPITMREGLDIVRVKSFDEAIRAVAWVAPS